MTSCQSLSKTKETGTIHLIKNIGEHFNMRCPLHPCNESGIYDFTKVNTSTGKLDLVHQGRELDTTFTDLSDAGTYCCKPHCANNTKSCCVNIQGIQHNYAKWVWKSGPIGRGITWYMHG